MMKAITYKEAEALRKQGQYQAAAEAFRALWEQQPSQFVGWRYAYCLRKTSRLTEAKQIAQEALAKYPKDPYTKAELARILYEKEFKPLVSKKQGDLQRALQLAEGILSLHSDVTIVPSVVMGVIKVAKGHNDWETVLAWSERVNPKDLNQQGSEFKGKQGMSKREAWYINRARAFLELNKPIDARKTALAGLQEFPDSIFLRRTAALALAASGNLVGAEKEMKGLLSHPRADWYMKAELAEIEFQLENYTEAYRLICEAVLHRQDERYKIRHFQTLARIALKLNKHVIAAEHVALAKIIRQEQGWSIPTDLLHLEEEIRQALEAQNEPWPNLPDDSKRLTSICKERWHEGRLEGLKRYYGQVKTVHKNKRFAFIQPDNGGEDIFILLRDLPRSCAQPGMRVEFSLEPSFDQKKGRQSVRAVKVRCLDRPIQKEATD